MIDRGERAGLALAAAGHVALLALLSASVLAPTPEALKPVPIEVALVDDASLESMAPNPSSEAPAAKLSPVEAPIEPDSAPPEPVEAPQPQPQPQPQPRPQPAPPKPAPPAKPQPAPAKPAPVAKPQPAPAKPKPAAAAKPAPAAAKPSSATAAKPATRRNAAPTGRLDGILAGLSDKPSPSKSVTPPAATAGPAVRSALGAEVLRQIKPRWRPPSGADSDKLRTTVQVGLNRDGTLAGEPRVTQTGVTDANRSQAELHRERAIRAVKLAAPFQLPPQYYDAWKTIAPTLYEGL